MVGLNFRIHRISANEIKLAIKRMKIDTNVGVDGMLANVW